MSAEIINLKRVRKARARIAKLEAAAENRVRFGKSRHERERQNEESERERRRHDGHRLPLPPDGTEPK
jgi:hypothetical protein